MSSDIDELLKTSRPAISQMITKEKTPTPAVASYTGSATGVPRHTRGMRPILFIILGVLFIGGLTGGGVWYLLPTPGLTPGALQTPAPPGTPQPAPVPVPVPPPQPLFQTDASRTITIPDNDRSVFLKLIGDTLQEPERPDTIKRILVKLKKEQSEHYASITELFNLWHITPPQNFLQHINPVSMLFVYYGSDGPRIGFVTKTRDPNRTLSDIFFWEQSLISDLAPFFFQVQEQTKPPDPPLFEDRTSSNTDWRYIKLSNQKDIGIGYMIFQANHLVVFTTSKTSMESIIKRFYGTQ